MRLHIFYSVSVFQHFTNDFHVYDISDRFIILDRGKVIHKLSREDVGSPEELIKIMKDTVSNH